MFQLKSVISGLKHCVYDFFRDFVEYRRYLVVVLSRPDSLHDVGVVVVEVVDESLLELRNLFHGDFAKKLMHAAVYYRDFLLYPHRRGLRLNKNLHVTAAFVEDRHRCSVKVGAEFRE